MAPVCRPGVVLVGDETGDDETGLLRIGVAGSSPAATRSDTVFFSVRAPADGRRPGVVSDPVEGRRTGVANLPADGRLSCSRLTGVLITGGATVRETSGDPGAEAAAWTASGDPGAEVGADDGADAESVGIAAA